MTTTHNPTAETAVDLWVNTVPARGGAIVGAVLIDLVIVLPFVATSAAGFVLGNGALGWTAAVAGAIAIAAILVDLCLHGRSVGRRICGLRTVAVATAAPIGLWPFTATRTTDVRHGRDPVTAAFAAYDFPAPQLRARGGGGVRHAILELDTGARLPLTGALVLGRDPGPRSDGASVHRWVDMSRTLSKAHALLEWDGAAVWVTDLASTNGTAFVGSPVVLAPFARTQVPFETRLRLGDRTLIASVDA